jgi:hypothetical protein
MTTTVPMPPDDKLTHWAGDTFVKTAEGPIPLDYWRMYRWLETLDSDAIRRIAVAISAPLPLPIALNIYDRKDNRDDLLTYLRYSIHRAYDIGMTVARIESGDFQP